MFSSTRRISLLFNTQRVDEDRRLVTSKKVLPPFKTTTAEAVAHLAKQVLPDWDIISFEQLLADPHIKVDLAVADVFHDSDAAADRKESSHALHILHDLQKSTQARRTILVASLPETGEHLGEESKVAISRRAAAQETPQRESGKEDSPKAMQVYESDNDDMWIKRFVPLATSNVNPWDELYNLLKVEESKIELLESQAWFETQLLRVDNGLSAHEDLYAQLFVAEVSRAESFEITVTGPIFIDGLCKDARVKNLLDLVKEKGLFGRIRTDFPFVVTNIELDTIRLFGCFFRQGFIAHNVKVKRSSYVRSCHIEKQFNLSRCSFTDFLAIENNTFGVFAGGENDEEKRRHSEKATRTPWFSQVTVDGEFAYRLNRVTCRDLGPSLSMMFNECVFKGRVDYLFPSTPSKLVFYHTRFESGSFVDISFPYLPVGSTNESAIVERFKDGIERQEIRFGFCDISAEIVVRESPYAVPIEVADTFGMACSGSQGKPPQYSAKEGIGVNLVGARLAGVLDFSGIRVRWLNCDRMTVAGGSLVMHPSAMFGDDALNDASPIAKMRSQLSSWFSVAPERNSLIHEELVVLGYEQPRFSWFFGRSQRYLELSTDRLLACYIFRSIAQQYEDVRKAFSNGSNSFNEEDFCQYKRLMWTSKANWLLLANHPQLLIFILNLLFYCVASGFGAYWLASLFELDEEFVGLACPYLILFACFAVIAISRDNRRIAKEAIDWFSRHLLGYLVFPSRVFLSMLLTLVLFAALFSICDTVASQTSLKWIGAIVDTADESSNPMVSKAASNLIDTESEGVNINTSGEVATVGGGNWRQIGKRVVSRFPTMLYYSCVTFTTLGYGDVVPRGFQRFLANTEAVVGAVWLSLMTVAIARMVRVN